MNSSDVLDFIKKAQEEMIKNTTVLTCSPRTKQMIETIANDIPPNVVIAEDSCMSYGQIVQVTDEGLKRHLIDIDKKKRRNVYGTSSM